LAKSFRGSLNLTRPDDQAAHCIKEVLRKASSLEPGEVGDVILGCARPYGQQGMNMARVALLRAGLPASIPGVTVNRFCSSGLQAVAMAAHEILHEGVDAAIGGGVESITAVEQIKIDEKTTVNPWVREHFPGIYMVMGNTAEVVAKRYRISRQAQDEYALASQQRTARAQREGFFREELAPMRVTRAVLDKKSGEVIGREEHYLDADECSRPDTTLEGLLALKPHFDSHSGQGTVTAGNSSQLSDGASATLLMEKVDDIDLWELNEAFAVQVVYCRDRLGIDPNRLNVNGGSIAIGHPFGMTGSRMVGTLANEMIRRKARYGVVTMCVGGGQGAAGLFELCN
jgi:acetyl-CoA acetyltransferase family protein